MSSDYIVTDVLDRSQRAELSPENACRIACYLGDEWLEFRRLGQRRVAVPAEIAHLAEQAPGLRTLNVHELRDRMLHPLLRRVESRTRFEQDYRGTREPKILPELGRNVGRNGAERAQEALDLRMLYLRERRRCTDILRTFVACNVIRHTILYCPSASADV
jgi:hypothetical protein